MVSFLPFSRFSFGGSISNQLALSKISLPGAIGMLGVALGVRNIQSQLPGVVYALLSGLNAATVGLIALAGVQLSERAITSKMTRFIISATGCVGILYQKGISTHISKTNEIALWYYPVLMVISGIAMVVYDSHIVHKAIRILKNRFRRTPPEEQLELGRPGSANKAAPSPGPAEQERKSIANDPGSNDVSPSGVDRPRPDPSTINTSENSPAEVRSDQIMVHYSIWIGIAILVFFLASFTAVMVVKGVLHDPPQLFRFFANMLLAGSLPWISVF